MSLEIDYLEATGKSKLNIGFESEDLKLFSGKRVLITGAGGSIGSRIAFLLKDVADIELFFLDQHENSLHSLALNLYGRADFDSQQGLIVCDIRNLASLKEVISTIKPQIIIHAAALKHLTVLEKFPAEAFMTNVIGSRNLLLCAYDFGIMNFLNISTDKAANPVNNLGKSKRTAELLVNRFREITNSNHTSVRFGNVFNSRGSVIETFSHQILNSLPVTVTHPDASRFFMHVDEAAMLVIKSLTINAGPVHVLNMGNQVRILDIVQRLELILGKKANVIFTGLKSGEKLEEDLTSRKEELTSTTNSYINVIKSPTLELSNEDFEIIRKVNTSESDFNVSNFLDYKYLDLSS